MARFPRMESVARAEEREVLLLWAGLGYYSRPRNLRKICQLLTAAAGPPSTPAEWARLPGIGPYTANAIASIGQNYDSIALDGNGIRVLARQFAMGGIFKNRRAMEGRLRPLADELAITKSCGAISEALIELGATLCTPLSPACDRCPLVRSCRARGEGMALEQIPRMEKSPLRRQIVHRVWNREGERLFLSQSHLGRLGDFWELPLLPAEIAPAALPVLLVGRRSIGRTRYEERIHGGPHGHSIGDASFSPKELERVPITGPHRKWISKLLQLGDPPQPGPSGTGS
jgi:A/G-specific adenine glycosylase